MNNIKVNISILLLYAIITVAITYPVAFELLHAIPGPQKESDGLEYLWLIWWYKKALVDRQISPADLPFYYPMETQLPLVTLTPLGWLIPLPLVTLFGPATAYSIYWLLSFLLSGYTAYLLGYKLTRSRSASFIGGVIFAFYPSKMLHALGHFGDLIIYMLPLYVLFLIKFWEKPSRRKAINLAIISAITLLIDFRHIALFILPFTLIFLLRAFLKEGRGMLTKRFLQSSALAVVIVAILTMPFFGPFIMASFGNKLGYLEEGGLEPSSADVLSFLLPPITHPVLSHISPLKKWMDAVWSKSLYFETSLYMGAIPLGLAILGIKRRFSQTGFWLAVSLVGMVIALGPVLKVGGQIHENIPLPYAFLHRLPFYDWVRIPARVDMMIKLALGIMAAFGFKELLSLAPGKPGILLTAGVSLIIMFEYLTLYPYPLYHLSPNHFLQALAKDGQDYGILTLSSHPYAMYLQTLHDHKIVEGHIHRWPPGALEWLLHLHGITLFPLEIERRYYDVLPPELIFGRDRGEIFASGVDISPASVLGRLGIRYLVFDKGFPWSKQDRKTYLSRLNHYFGEPTYQDERLNIYEITVPASDTPVLVKGRGWYTLECSEKDIWRWMGSEATIHMEGQFEGPYRLKLAATSLQKPLHPSGLSPSGRSLQIYGSDELIGEYEIEGGREIITPPFKLDRKSKALRFHVPEGCQRPFNLLKGNLDTRCLSLSFNEVRVFPSTPKPPIFGEQIQLVGFELSEKVSNPGERVYLALYWQALRKMERDFTAFVHLVDDRGLTVTQDDRLLLDRAQQPTAAWAENEGVRVIHELQIPPEAIPGRYRIKVGLYEMATMERLRLVDDESGENAVILAKLEIR